MESRVWKEHAITRRLADGWFDATAMSTSNDNKRFYEYSRTQSGWDFMEATAAELSTKADTLWTTSRGGASPGTWIHPRLALDFGRWLSPSFGAWLETWIMSSSEISQASGSQQRLWGQQIQILSETDLHTQVVSWVRNKHPKALLIPGLGELQDSQERRIQAYGKGYKLEP